MKTTKTLTLANPRGFCAGVDRAINIVEKALAKYGSPIFCSLSFIDCVLQ